MKIGQKLWICIKVIHCMPLILYIVDVFINYS